MLSFSVSQFILLPSVTRSKNTRELGYSVPQQGGPPATAGRRERALPGTPLLTQQMQFAQKVHSTLLTRFQACPWKSWASRNGELSFFLRELTQPLKTYSSTRHLRIAKEEAYRSKVPSSRVFDEAAPEQRALDPPSTDH